MNKINILENKSKLQYLMTYIYWPTPPHKQDVTRVQLKVKFNSFEFRIFLL